MSLLTPDLGLLFWMLVSFGLVFGILAKFGFPVITRMVDRRRNYIEESLKAADQANQKLESVEKDARKLMDDAQKRQAELLAAAVSDSERIVQRAREKAEQDAADRLEAAKNQIEIEKQKALRELRTTVATISVDVAEKVLRGALDEKSTEQSYIGRLVDEAEKHAGDKAQS